VQNQNRHNRGGFTLVELLAVILIMGMLMLFAIPSFQSASRGGRVRSAVFQLNSTISLARQNAITSRQNVHILFPDSSISYGPETIDLAYRAYSLYGSRDGYLAEWRILPEGVVFQRDFRFSQETGNAIRNIFLQTGTNYLKNVVFPSAEANQSERVLALTFRPDGALDHAAFNPKGVYLTDGFIEPDFDNFTIPDSGVFFRTNVTVYAVEIRPESGQSRIREYNP
jgi:prepilin-type N-terminal cleavage/methylation domain-containing protein